MSARTQFVPGGAHNDGKKPEVPLRFAADPENPLHSSASGQGRMNDAAQRKEKHATSGLGALAHRSKQATIGASVVRPGTADPHGHVFAPQPQRASRSAHGFTAHESSEPANKVLSFAQKKKPGYPGNMANLTGVPDYHAGLPKAHIPGHVFDNQRFSVNENDSSNNRINIAATDKHGFDNPPYFSTPPTSMGPQRIIVGETAASKDQRDSPVNGRGSANSRKRRQVDSDDEGEEYLEPYQQLTKRYDAALPIETTPNQVFSPLMDARRSSSVRRDSRASSSKDDSGYGSGQQDLSVGDIATSHNPMKSSLDTISAYMPAHIPRKKKRMYETFEEKCKTCSVEEWHAEGEELFKMCKDNFDSSKMGVSRFMESTKDIHASLDKRFAEQNTHQELLQALQRDLMEQGNKMIPNFLRF